MTRKLKKIILPFLFFLTSVGFFRLYLGGSSQGLFPKESYFVPPLNLDFSREPSRPLPRIERPVSPIGYLREIIREGNFSKEVDKNWEFLAGKRIAIAIKSTKMDILGNYKGLQQLVEWHTANRPADWEFWKFKQLETWEANLAQYYSLLDHELDYVIGESKNETEKIEKLVKMGGAIKSHQRDLDWVVSTWPMEDHERVYLKKICDDIYSALWERIKSIVPDSRPNEYVYSVQLTLFDRNFGDYNLWFETGWFGGEKAASVVEILNGASLEKKKLFVEDRYGLALGGLVITEESKELAVKIQLPLEAQISEAPRVLLKKVADLSGGDPSIKKEEKPKNITSRSGKIYFAGFILSFLLFLYSIKRKDFFKKILYLPRFFLKINRRNSFVLICVYLIGVFLGGRNWDFLAIWTFFFWTAIALVWKIDSRVSFLVALGLLLSCPAFVILKKESRVENLAVFSYFFILTGTIQKVAEERRGALPQPARRGLFQDVLICFLQTIITFLAIFVILWLIKETIFYHYFFGTTFIKEMFSRLLIKMVIMWVALGVLLKIIFLSFKKIFRRNLAVESFLKKSACFDKLVFLLALFSLIGVLNGKLFAYSRSFFEHAPHIFSVSPDIGSPGTKVTVTGHNFREKGVVYLNGIVQVINEWDDERIVFEITDEYSDTGLIKVKSEYGSKPLESNGIRFTFIDTSPPAEKEMEIF